MTRIYRLFIIFAAACATFAAAAQEVSFSAIPPRGAIREGDKFSVSFRLANASANAPARPEIEGCTLIFGPSTSSRQSYSVVNGAVTSTSSVDFSYTYRADKAGTYTVGPVKVSAAGKTYTTKPFRITILAGGAAAAAGAQGQSTAPHPVDMADPATQSADRRVAPDDVFVRISLSKSRIYEQEAVVCTIKLYTKYQISSFMPTLQPSFDGFLIEELDIQPSLNEVESLGGQNYMTAILKKCILFPQRAGHLTITSGNYDITVVQYERINMGLMTVSNPTERQIKVSSNKASVDILPLPEPRPDGFTGAVGSFKVDSRLIGNTFRTDEAASLIYTIQGTGNIKYLKEPVVDFPSEFELYEPQSDIDTRVSGGSVTGTMTVNYTFVPQQVGNFKIGSDKFVYFDPAKRAYETITTPPFSIKVTPGSPSAAAAARDITSKNTDILHIKTGDKRPAIAHPLIIYQGWYWAMYAAAFLILAAYTYTNRRRMRMSADVVATRNARAGKEARKRLRAAAACMDKGDSEHFYEALLQAMWGFLSDRLNIPASQLSRENVSEELAAYGASEDTRSRLMALLDDCEMARYAPGDADSAGAMRDRYNEASALINALMAVRRR